MVSPPPPAAGAKPNARSHPIGTVEKARGYRSGTASQPVPGRQPAGSGSSGVGAGFALSGVAAASDASARLSSPVTAHSTVAKSNGSRPGPSPETAAGSTSPAAACGWMPPAAADAPVAETLTPPHKASQPPTLPPRHFKDLRPGLTARTRHGPDWWQENGGANLPPRTLIGTAPAPDTFSFSAAYQQMGEIYAPRHPDCFFRKRYYGWLYRGSRQRHASPDGIAGPAGKQSGKPGQSRL